MTSPDWQRHEERNTLYFLSSGDFWALYFYAGCVLWLAGGSQYSESTHVISADSMRVAGSSTLTSVLSVVVTEEDTDQNADHFSTPAATAVPGATRECSSDDDCNGELGETCVRVYDGCQRGQCMCDLTTGPPARLSLPPPPPTDRDRQRPWDVASNPGALGYCHHVARMFDKLDAKCDLC